MRFRQVIEAGGLHGDADAAPDLLRLMVNVVARDTDLAGGLLEQC